MARVSEESGEYKSLKRDIAQGTPAQLYVFFGEENYLKEYYLGRLRELCAGAFDEFNTVRLEGEKLSARDFADAVDSLPMGSERKLVVVRDYRLLSPTGEMKQLLPETLSSLPPYICLVFYFDTVEFKPDKRLSLYKQIEQHGKIVPFRHATAGELVPWLRKRFSALGKDISACDCEYMLFICGSSMTVLAQEVSKIAAGTRTGTVARGDIDRLATRVLEAQVFDMTDSILEGRYARAVEQLRDLFALRNDPVPVLAAIARQMQRLYGAKLVIADGGGESALAELFAFRSMYPAKLLARGAGRVDLGALRKVQQMCLDADLALKSSLPDPERTVELLLLRIAHEVAQ